MIRAVLLIVAVTIEIVTERSRSVILVSRQSSSLRSTPGPVQSLERQMSP